MSSTKTITRISSGGSKMPLNHSQWSQNLIKNQNTNSKLLKAKSNPNVSKSTTISRQMIKIDSSTSSNFQNRKSTTLNSKQLTKSTKICNSTSKNNITIVEISTDNTTGNHFDNNEIKKITKKTLITSKNDENKKLKDISCTILEDRALLKKGLNLSSNKLQKKTDTIRQKNLSRSTSLWSVPADKDTKNKKINETIETKNNSKIKSYGNLNRTTSLWNVPTNNSSKILRTKSINTLRPSKIPLFTQNYCNQNNLGQSLGDLSLVDHSIEKLKPKIIDFDEIDNSNTEHIYENCSDVILCNKNNYSSIYENSKNELIRTKSVPIDSQCNSFESRTAELITKLDENEENIEELNSRIDHDEINFENNQNLLSKNCDNVDNSNDELSNNNDELIKTNDNLHKNKNFDIVKSNDNLYSRRIQENNIQEIRRNWENQIKLSQNNDDNELINKIKLKINLKKLPEKDNIQIKKKTKDIEELVNFFNCKNKNFEKTKDIITDNSWKNKETIKKDDKINGYFSDGNCSEDSGHISNENDIEWKDDNHNNKNNVKTENFLKEIINDLDKTIEVFD